MSKRGRGRPKQIDSHDFRRVPTAKSGELNNNLPEFFKIYFASTCSQRMRIPPSFVMKNFDGYIPSIFTLKSPSGNMTWRVDPEMIKEDWYFQKGWSKFVQQNLLEDGDFLTFSLHGSSSFYVRVFATNGCRKSVEDFEASHGRH